MKFIHTADLHLDTPFDGIKNDLETPKSLWQELKEAPYVSFTKIVDQAIEGQVDFMLIAGDIFDSKNQSVKAISFFIEQMNRLDKANIPVMLSFGNHDFQSDEGKHFDFPKNVYVFPQAITTHELILKDGKTVAITGFSYTTQAVSEDIVKDFPFKGRVDYQIGMVHGEIGKAGDDNYAPFTISEMESKGYDYWALGHIHKRGELNVSPMIEYPGDIQGRHKNESGEKGYLLVTENDGALNKQFIATSPIIFESLTIKIDSTMDISEVIKRIISEIISHKFNNLHLINLNLETTDGGFNEEIMQGVAHDILIHSLQKEISSQYQQLNAWIYEIKLFSYEKTKFSNLDQKFWDESRTDVFSKETVTNLAKKLFENEFIRAEFNNDEALQNLVEKSEELIKSEVKGDDTENED